MCVCFGRVSLLIVNPRQSPPLAARLELPCERLTYSFRALRIDCTTSVTHINFPQASHEWRHQSVCACEASFHSMSLR